LKTSGLNFEIKYLVKERVHNFRTFKSYILPIPRKEWGSGKYFCLKKGSAGEQV
jgi:hypothetical protein